MKAFFEFGHLKESEERAFDVADRIKEMDEEYQRFVYRIVKAIDDK